MQQRHTEMHPQKDSSNQAYAQIIVNKNSDGSGPDEQSVRYIPLDRD